MIAAMTSYRGDEAIDWFGFSQLWSQTVGYAVTTSRIDSLNRRKTFSKSLASARLLFIFIIKSSLSGDISICDFVCCSAFTQTKRDYRENQRPRSILKKERVHIATNTTTVLFDRLYSLNQGA